MYPESAERTLLADWQARRERLATRPAPVGQLGGLHIQILDYLIGRYADSPEAARPARFSPKSDLYVNDRAIVVHHHLWQGKVSGVKSRQEAETRVSAVLKQLISLGEPVPSNLWNKMVWAIRLRRKAHSAIEAALKRSPFLPIEALRYLYQRLADPALEDRCALDLLARCENRNAPDYCYYAWRKRLEAGKRDGITDALERLSRRPGADQERRRRIREQIAQKCRAELASNDPAARLKAIDILGRIGTLDDIGLLSDLLCLPPLKDEHPEERAALARAMQQISQAE
jgi:hypothetical protein